MASEARQSTRILLAASLLIVIIGAGRSGGSLVLLTNQLISPQPQRSCRGSSPMDPLERTGSPHPLRRRLCPVGMLRLDRLSDLKAHLGP